MASPEEEHDIPEAGRGKRRFNSRTMLWNNPKPSHNSSGSASGDTSDQEQAPSKRPPRWNMGMLNDRETDEVPGSVLLLSKVSEYNEPLGLRNQPARTSASSLPTSIYPPSRSSSQIHRRRASLPKEKKRTPDGKFVLEPQPDDSLNDPLNWKAWRRDAALLSLGFYCMLGGGMTPILAAGFNNVAQEYGVPETRVALTTGLYMLGLGIGSVLLSPTAILFGKRPVYLVAAVCFILSSVWCALSPNFGSLVAARIVQGIAVSSVECLPSATIAEIYFLHEKGYRLGIYTLLLLGGKNLVPLVSAAIIESLGWRWVFWVVAIIVGFGLVLLFFFVPETFWDRTPRPHKPRVNRKASFQQAWRAFSHSQPSSPAAVRKVRAASLDEKVGPLHEPQRSTRHAHFQADESPKDLEKGSLGEREEIVHDSNLATHRQPQQESLGLQPHPASPDDYFTSRPTAPLASSTNLSQGPLSPLSHHSTLTNEPVNPYTRHYMSHPPKTYREQLRPFSGRLCHDNWFKVALRPFILFAYPSILWSALVYSLSVGWLIVLSESITQIYKSRSTYAFTSLQAGLIYISPFIGGVLGTAVAGKVSDLVVRWLARRNGGVYEPEFRLLMTAPIVLTTGIGLMGYGWSAASHDAWIVPTLFFGILSFGCSLGSTTSITFAVDSYRQYAGEALVSLNFAKNVLHGLVFSLFFNDWLVAKGSKQVFLVLGGVQVGVLVLATAPMFVLGKRARMWTVRRDLMGRF